MVLSQSLVLILFLDGSHSLVLSLTLVFDLFLVFLHFHPCVLESFSGDGVELQSCGLAPFVWCDRVRLIFLIGS